MQKYTLLSSLMITELQELKDILRQQGISAIGRDEVSSFLNEKIPTSYEEDFRSFYILYSVRRDDAAARKRMNLTGPHQTLEAHYMKFILERAKEKQHNDIYAK